MWWLIIGGVVLFVIAMAIGIRNAHTMTAEQEDYLEKYDKEEREKNSIR